MVLRTQHAGWRSPWSDALRAQMPRFGVAGSASLAPPLPRAGGLQAGEPLKLSLAFADSQVVVPWLPVVDGDGSVLTALTLTFVCDHEAGDTHTAELTIAQLCEGGLSPLALTEFLAMRLYTGPMFVKYNAATGRAPTPRVSTVSATHSRMPMSTRNV